MDYGILGGNPEFPAQNRISCIDAGSENCPCYLAQTGDCLVCSRLQGKDSCNCNWHGVCIYNEFMQGNKRVNNPRKDFEATIVETKFYQEDLVVYVLDVGKGFALKADRPGTYLFVKASGMNGFYDLPISVMKADAENGHIHLAIKIISTKTKALLTEKEKFILRGPYRNGIHGVSPMIKKRGKDQKTLIVAKGIGIAPSIMAYKALRYKGQVDLIADTEKINAALIEDYLDENESVRCLSLAGTGAEAELEALMKAVRYDNVLLLVSDYYLELLGRMAKKILPTADLALSNNFRICCGEGLCGSCAVDTQAGGTVKMCKCKLNGEELLDQVLPASPVLRYR